MILIMDVIRYICIYVVAEFHVRQNGKLKSIQIHGEIFAKCCSLSLTTQ